MSAPRYSTFAAFVAALERPSDRLDPSLTGSSLDVAAVIDEAVDSHGPWVVHSDSDIERLRELVGDLAEGPWRVVPTKRSFALWNALQANRLYVYER